MSFSGLFARIVALIGGAALLWRRMQGAAVHAPAWGSAPAIPAANPQGAIPTLKLPTAKGWAEGQKPAAAPGLKVNAFATGLKHPRWIYVLPNGDVLIAEASQVPAPVRSVFGYAMQATMRRAAALGVSANRITLLRDRDGDGVAETSEDLHGGTEPAFRHGAIGRHLLCRQHRRRGGLPVCGGRRPHHGARAQAYPLQVRRALDAEPAGEPRRPEALCRRRLAQQYRRELAWRSRKAGLPSTSSIWRAARARIFASGLRNPVGLAWEPQTGVLWTVVNERDGLGDETPPDYLTSVRDGGFYGWPYCYWGQTVDDRVPQDPAAVAKAITPDYALGGHTASLGLCWLPAGTLPGFPDGMVIGQHGSWNRSTLSGYKVVFIPFVNGRPSGPPRDILSGFLAPDEKVSYGRPVGVTLGPDGSLLVADDVGDVIWRVTGADQG